MSYYPTAIPNTTNYPDRTDDVSWIYAARYNEIKNEVIALCKELGISPSGGSDTLLLRLATLALKSNVLELDNEDAFTPDNDYEPATKKYVDDNIRDADKIEEGNSSVEVVDAGDGKVNITVDGVLVGEFNDEGLLSPTRPVFLAKPTSSQDNIASDGSNVEVILGTEVYDVGNNFASNTFTAPVTGKYQLSVNIYLVNFDKDANFYICRLTTSNRTYSFVLPSKAFNADGNSSFSASVLADMDVNDTAFIYVAQASGGASQTDIDTNTYFTGIQLA